VLHRTIFFFFYM